MNKAAQAWAPVDWQQPWFRELRAVGEPAFGQVAQGVAVHAALQAAARASPVRFVPQDALPPGEAYERFIFAHRQCPTRDNLHDFFNGLIWLLFPRTKQRLNQLQAAEIAERGIQPVRGPVRDSLTLFDENGAFFLAPPALWAALVARDWKALFIELRPLWADAQLVPFGHALLEQLARPRKPITAHVYLGRAPAGRQALDRWAAEALEPAGLAAKPFTPLPVLGVPGWWAENENFSFYDDSTVFRAAQRPKTSKNLRETPIRTA